MVIFIFFRTLKPIRSQGFLIALICPGMLALSKEPYLCATPEEKRKGGLGDWSLERPYSPFFHFFFFKCA